MLNGPSKETRHDKYGPYRHAIEHKLQVQESERSDEHEHRKLKVQHEKSGNSYNAMRLFAM